MKINQTTCCSIQVLIGISVSMDNKWVLGLLITVFLWIMCCQLQVLCITWFVCFRVTQMCNSWLPRILMVGKCFHKWDETKFLACSSGFHGVILDLNDLAPKRDGNIWSTIQGWDFCDRFSTYLTLVSFIILCCPRTPRFF